MNPSASTPQEIDVHSFNQKLQDSSDSPQLIDVREPQEVDIAAVPGFVNLPLSQFADWETRIHEQFDVDAETIVMCHHGMRSAQMCQWLRGQGFTQVKNLTGGIDAYAALVNPAIPRY